MTSIIFSKWSKTGWVTSLWIESVKCSPSNVWPRTRGRGKWRRQRGAEQPQRGHRGQPGIQQLRHQVRLRGLVQIRWQGVMWCCLDKAVWRILLRSPQQVGLPLRGGPGAEPLPQGQDRGQKVRKALKWVDMQILLHRSLFINFSSYWRDREEGRDRAASPRSTR